MCLNPKWIYKKGYYKENNYRGLKGDFYELGTYSKCGACSQCISEKANNWVIRNHYESMIQEKKCFITLTYRDNSIILVRKDFQDFMKRLRIKLARMGKEKIRMYQCGEYGEISGRPHGHIIIYGWEDENVKYLGINSKKNIIYQSKIIQECWGLGRTSYQTFNEKEIPYISLYNTPKETFKRAYKMSREKLKKLKDYAITHRTMNKAQKDNLLAEIKEMEKRFEDEKLKYQIIREFNSWSIALGWEKFYDIYSKQKEYTWTEYIEGAEFVTPSPWVKKLANMGDIKAKEEMIRRENEIIQSATEQEEKNKQLTKVISKRKKEIEEYTKNEDKSIL